jgi:hypothetical protein
MPLALNNLGNSLSGRFKRLGDDDDLKSAISCYSEAAESATGSVRTKLGAAKEWILLAQSHATDSVLDACRVAMKLIPHLTWLGSSIADRHYRIKDVGAVTREAAVVAISQQQYEMAVEWLEQGRSVIWNQLLQLRSSMDDLCEACPVLASDFESVSRQLEGSTIRTLSDNRLDATNNAPDYHDLAHRRDKLLESIRLLTGFENFLLPKPVTQLLPAAKTGPIVMLNLSEKGAADALILCPDSRVLHLSLWNAPPNDSTNEQNSHQEGTPEPSTQRVLDILKHLDHIRKPHLDHQDHGGISTLLYRIWYLIVHPILNALTINVRLFAKLIKCSHPYSSDDNVWYLRYPPHMVVPNRSLDVPSYPCSRHLSIWTQAVRLRRIFIRAYSHYPPRCTPCGV